jgi:hydroxymethylbilane synthase
MKRLQQAWPGLVCNKREFVTKGDKSLDRPLPLIGGKGLFTAELESALHTGEIDIAVHSLKDLPIEDAPGLSLGAIGSRADVRDVLVARKGWTLQSLPKGARVGTSSVRRQAQLLAHRPDLKVKSIRGNVDTRIRKVLAGEYEAAVLAAAGLERLNMTEVVTEWLDLDIMMPAPGQGALAVQCRAGDSDTLSLLSAIDEPDVRRSVNAERAFLHALGGGCSAPVAAHAILGEGEILLEALIAAPDGSRIYRVAGGGPDPGELGKRLAQQATSLGGGDIIEGLEAENAAKPLQGKRIVVTRARAQAAAFSRKLAALGAQPLEIPMIRTVPVSETDKVDQAAYSLGLYDWVLFTSVNGVEKFWHRLEKIQRRENRPTEDLPMDTLASGMPNVAAIGPVTANALLERGVQPAFTPDTFVGEAVAAGLGELQGKRVLLLRAEKAREALPLLLEAQGASVDDLPVYRTVPIEPDASARAKVDEGVDVVTFTSSSTVQHWVAAFAEISPRPLIACIGPVTARTAEKLGLRPDIVAEDFTTDGLIEAITNYFSRENEP